MRARVVALLARKMANEVYIRHESLCTYSHVAQLPYVTPQHCHILFIQHDTHKSISTAH